MNKDLNCKQSNSHRERFSFRTVTILPILCFMPAVVIYKYPTTPQEGN